MYDVVPDKECRIRSNEVASVVAITRRFGVRNMSYADTLIHYSYKQNTLCSIPNRRSILLVHGTSTLVLVLWCLRSDKVSLF